MSDFWGSVLAPVTPTTTPTQRPGLPPAGTYSPSPFFAPQQPAQQFVQQPAQVVEQPGQWGSVAGSTKKAQSAKQTSHCPGCASGNYLAPEGSGRARCFDCGYPVIQSTSGGGGLPSEKGVAATPSRQTALGGAGGVSNFQPQNPAAGHI